MNFTELSIRNAIAKQIGNGSDWAFSTNPDIFSISVIDGFFYEYIDLYASVDRLFTEDKSFNLFTTLSQIQDLKIYEEQNSNNS